MFRKVVLALTVAATFAGTALTMAAPAQAGWREHHRRHDGYHNRFHGPVYGLSDGYFAPRYGACHLERRGWWRHGYWHGRVVRVCY